MAYTFKEEGTNVAVFDNEKRVATGTPDFASKQYGYQTPQPAAMPEPQLSPISTPTPAPTLTGTPALPQLEAPAVQEAAIVSAFDAAKTARTTLDTTYKKQIDDIQAKTDVADANIAGITAKQDSLLTDDINPLLTPFRETLEKSERDRLKVDENYFANQALVNELDTLLSEGNNYIKQQQGLPVNQRVVNRKVAKAMDDVNARSGVIQAVMNARNGQIAQAYTMIDRSANAITADRKDRLEYFKSLFDFYENQKSDAKATKKGLDEDKKDYIDAQIKQLEKDLEQADKNVQHIKDLMVDPDTAMFMGRSGITLNDTPEQVAQKMQKQAEIDEIEKNKNKLIEDGYTFSPVKTANTKEFTFGGKVMHFTPPPSKVADVKPTITLTPEKKTVLAGTGLSAVDINDVEKIVNDFGVKRALEVITDPAQRQAIADVYNAQTLLDEILAAAEPTPTKKWWEFWK